MPNLILASQTPPKDSSTNQLRNQTFSQQTTLPDPCSSLVKLTLEDFIPKDFNASQITYSCLLIILFYLMQSVLGLGNKTQAKKDR